MKSLILSSAILVAVGLPLAAQDIAQSGSEWFKNGQSAVDARLANQPVTGRAKNVILFIADGQGVGTNYAVRLFSGQKAGGLGDDYVQPQEAFPNVALVKTYTTNGQTPDSAPTAAAMNTGVKQKNEMINIDGSVATGDCAGAKGHELTTFAEIVSGMGKSVGVITTTRITHATPAAVYAKSAHRDWEDNASLPEGCDQKDIAAQLVEMMKSGVIDVALGGGRSNFLPAGVTDEEGKAGRRTDDRNLIDEVKAMGGQYVWDEAGFMALTSAGNAPVLGLFEPSHMMFDADRKGEPSLSEMTEATIRSLSQNADGYYLMVEGGRVDHANHEGNAARALADGKAFADAVAKAVEMTDPNDTLIVVTADHEHAIAFNGYCGRGSDVTGLCMEIDPAGEKNTGVPILALDGKPYSVIGYLNGPGSVLTEGSNPAFSGTRPALTQDEATKLDALQQALIPLESETHSGEDVPLFARGPWAHLFGGVIEQNYIFHAMLKAVSAE